MCVSALTFSVEELTAVLEHVPFAEATDTWVHTQDVLPLMRQMRCAFWYGVDHVKNCDGAMRFLRDFPGFVVSLSQHLGLDWDRRMAWRQIRSLLDADKGIPRCGAVLLDASRTQCLLTLGCNGRWVVPKGKAEAGETELVAALREVSEETGFRFHTLLRAEPHRYRDKAGRQVVLFLTVDVPTDFAFRPKWVSEVSQYRWAPVTELSRDLQAIILSTPIDAQRHVRVAYDDVLSTAAAS